MAKAKVVQFVSILPVNRVPHVIVHEVAEKDMPEDFEVYASDRIYVEYNGKQVACRVQVVEKEVSNA